MPVYCDKTRRKAVWGPKRTLAASFVLMMAFAATTFAAGGREHARAGSGPRRTSNSQVGATRSIRALKRSSGNGYAKTRVIVELQPGADVPPAFRRYMRHNGKLGIINGQVLELPNRLIASMSQHPDVFRLHFDRPTKGANYRTALTTGTRVVQKTSASRAQASAWRSSTPVSRAGTTISPTVPRRRRRTRRCVRSAISVSPRSWIS
jgi:hypothetical protein